MRNMIYLIIINLCLSGMANAAMVCCWGAGGSSNIEATEKSQTITRSHCHQLPDNPTSLEASVEISDHAIDTSSTDTSDCQCQSACFKSGMSHTVDIGTPVQDHTYFVSYNEQLSSGHLLLIDHPPK